MVTAPNVSAVGTIGLTVTGGYFFGPVGAAAGAVLGSFLFGSSGPDIEGPRLGDTSVSASTYGNVIPVAFGVQKLAGAMIWATDIIEDKNTRKEGDGVFGGGQKITEYRYYANFAVAFAEGPCTGLLRLWAGEKLLADLQAPDLAGGDLDTLADAMRYFVRNKRYKFRFYRGTSDQEPDPLIVRHVEKEVGANATPAFRDLVYLVFEHLPLDEFGNRIPPITAEIAWTQVDEQPIRELQFLAGGGIFAANTFQLGSGMLDDRRHRFYVRTTSSPGGIRRFNLLTGKEDFQVPYSTDMDPDGGTGWETGTYDLDGNVYLAADGGSDIIKADGDSLTHIETLESALFGYSDMDCGHAFTLSGFVPILFCATTLGSMRIVRADAPMALIHTGSGLSPIGGVVRGSEATFGQVQGWYASRGFPTPGATIELRRYIVSASAQAGAGISYTDYAITAADVGGTMTSPWATSPTTRRTPASSSSPRRTAPRWASWSSSAPRTASSG
jgi:hypothetical protein